ncbi:MAG: recombination mediator RecR [bacterium]|nr:recombination mediator RecR [bacterium]
MVLPKAIQKLIEAFERLPGIGPKTAARLTFYLLHVPQEELDRFSQAVGNLKKETVICPACFNVSETDPCPICQDSQRDQALICVVEEPLDLLSLEKTGKYKGLYHVLHGVIDPLNNIGPDELYIRQLVERIRNQPVRQASPDETGGESGISEVILATNPTMEGEATAMYIAKQLRELSAISHKPLAITRLAHGLPMGGDLEYADEVTLTHALEGRREF